MQKKILLSVLMLLTFSITLDALAETKVGGPIAIDMTWTLDKSPYIVVQNIEVAEGATLTIEPGVTVRFDGDYALIISGTLIARGTKKNMITFANGYGIKFADSSIDAVFDKEEKYISGGILEYCEVYSSSIVSNSASPFINYCTIRDGDGISISIPKEVSVIISNNTISENSKGISISGGTATIKNGNIYRNSGVGIYISYATVTINESIVSGNSDGGVYSYNSSLTITNSTISSNSDTSYDGADYSGGITAKKSTLIIDNSIISDNSAGIYSAGGGICCRDSSLTITNSTIHGNVADGGGGIYTDGGKHVISNNIITNNSALFERGFGRSGSGGGICIIGSGEITNNTIRDNYAVQDGGGIYALLYSSSLSITNNLISNNSVSEWGGGIYGDSAFGSELTLFVNHNVITGNSDGVYLADVDAKSTINNNNIYNNEIYGVINVTTFDIDAKNNWWGTIDPMEINQKIYDFFDKEKYGKVLYNPFLLAPDTEAPVIAPTGLKATVEGTAINLTWETINLDDLAGYKVYYDTDSDKPPYEGTEAAEGKSPVDVGKVTSYKLSGLKPGTKYYIAITAYDTQGNEGWYGEIVTAETAAAELESPLPPKLSSPDDDVVIDTFTPTLKWVASESATSYGVQIAKNSQFSDILIDKSGITGVQYYVPSDNLKNLETYYWRVNATNSAGTSDWSEVRTFKIISGPSFTLSLSAALNFISLPMKPDVPYTARTFAEKLGATLVIRFDSPSQEFVPFVSEVSETDGFVIEGGQGYIVNVLEEKQVTFTGSLWTNTPPASPKQAPDKENAIWAFAVAGLISTEPDLKESFSELRVTVKNQRTGQLSQCALTDDMGEFATAFVDMSRKSVIKAGDMLEITVRNSRGELVSVPVVQEVSETDLTKATVVANLRLGEVIPSQSQLFQNYPNPFNPETWIPFQLAESAEVTIRIYNVSGQLVRMLNLGQKTAGRYLDKTRAVYWDGRNEHNEKISSGVYFYSIEAGNFRATRKLVVAK